MPEAQNKGNTRKGPNRFVRYSLMMPVGWHKSRIRSVYWGPPVCTFWVVAGQLSCKGWLPSETAQAI